MQKQQQAKLGQADLLRMLTYRRPAGSKTEREFIRKYLDTVPGMYSDAYGNRILTCPGSRTMIACHTDTVHHVQGKQRIRITQGVAHLGLNSPSNCLGADDTAGVYAALRMIEAGVQATFIFHREEERGGRGSTWLAYNYPEWLADFDVCLSLDRRGTRDVITSQFCERTASDAFAWSLADALDMGHRPAEGIFTDSANYSGLIPECSNLSVGYEHEHTRAESLDLVYLETLITKLCAVDWTALHVARDPAVVERTWDGRVTSLVSTDTDSWNDDRGVMFPGSAPCDLCGVKERYLTRLQEGFYVCSVCKQYEWEEREEEEELAQGKGGS